MAERKTWAVIGKPVLAGANVPLIVHAAAEWAQALRAMRATSRFDTLAFSRAVIRFKDAERGLLALVPEANPTTTV